MNILMLHPHDLFYFPWTIRIIRLAQEIVRAGHRVTIGYIKVPDETKMEHEKKLRDSLPEGPQYLAFSARGRNLLSAWRQLRGSRPAFDLVHFQKCFSTMALPALYLAYDLGCPIHYDWDDNEAGLAEIWIRFAPARWEVKLYERLLPRVVDTVTTASEELRQKSISRGMAPEDIFPAPVGANLEQFHPDHDGRPVRERLGLGDTPVVLYMGQLGGAAYAHQLLDAAAYVLRQVPETRFLIVGGGRTLKPLEIQTSILGIQNRVIFTGYVPQDEVPDYVAAADVAVATFEDNDITRCKSPLKIAEYLAAGKPIVASNTGEVPTMLGDSGILVEPGNTGQLVEGILKYLREPSLRKTHQNLARKRAEEVYNWPATAKSLLAAYERAREKREAK